MTEEVADLGSLFVNLYYSGRLDATEQWKIDKIINDEVYPTVYFYLEAANNRGYRALLLDFPD